MSKLDKFIPDGSKIRLYGSGNLSAGTIQVANETLLLSGPSAHVGISDGNNLVFLGDGQTIGVSGANTLNVGFSGNTVNLNVGGVNYVFPDSLTSSGTGAFLTTGAGDARYVQYTETGAFASNVNLQTVSGRVSSVSGTTQALSGQTQGLQGQINTINAKTGTFVTTAQTGQFYAANNPSGFITAAEAGGVQSLNVTGKSISGVIVLTGVGVNVTSAGQTITIGISTGQFLTTGAGDSRYIQYTETGAFASNVNLQTVSGSVAAINAKTGTFITSAQTGRFVDTGSNQTISGIKTFRGGIYTYGNVDIRDSNSLTTAQLNWRALYDKSESLSLDWGERILSGTWTGQALIIDGFPVLTQGSSGQFLTTGAADARYIQYTETGAFASNVNLQTVSGRVSSVSGSAQALSGQTQGLQAQITTINNKTGVFITDAQTGQFYAANNPAGYITSAEVSGTGVTYVAGLTASIGVIGGGNVSISTGTPNSLIISGATGAFASNVNLQTVSGRVNSVSGTTQALSGQTQGLQSQISTVVAKTGAFLTTGAGDGRYIQYTETGAFASNVNLQTISGKTGTYVTTGESRYVHFSGLVEMDDVKYVVRDQDANVHVMKTNVSASFINSTGGIVLNTSIPRNVSRRIDILVRGGDYASKSQTSTWFKTIIQTSSYLNGNIDGLPGAIFIAKNINLGNNQDCPVYAGVGKNGCIALGIGTTGFINRYVWYNADVWVGDTSPSDYSTGWYWSLETGANLSFGDIVEVPNTFPYTSGGSGGSPLTDVVYTTGNQSIYGVKSYLNSIWTNGFAAYSGAYIYDSTENGFLSFNADARALYDANESTSLKWGTRQLTGTWHVQNLLISGNKVLTGTAGGAGVESITISGGASYAGALTFTGVNGITISGSGSQLLFNATNHRVVTPRDIYDSPPTGAGTWWSGYTTGVGIGSGPNAGDFWVDWRSGENFSYTLMKGANGFVWLPHVYMTGSIEAKTIFVSFINTGAGMPASSQHPFGWRGEPIYWSLGGFSYLYTDYTGLANIGLGTPTSPAVDVFMFRKINGMVIGSKFAEYALINQGV